MLTGLDLFLGKGPLKRQAVDPLSQSFLAACEYFCPQILLRVGLIRLVPYGSDGKNFE